MTSISFTLTATFALGHMLAGVLERFTGPARESILRARREASAMGHREVGAEHLLLGLFSAQDDIVSRLLADAGLSIQVVREMVRERVVAEPPGYCPGDGPSFSPPAKDAVTFAYRFGMGEPSTAHILIALVARGENGAAAILRALGEEPGRLRFEAKRLLLTGDGSDGPRLTTAARPMLPELDFGD
jgi:ATP-dependent Clp protease ATP-binding subunit ClpA